MLIIKPIEDKTEQKALCDACNTAFLHGDMAYAARVDGELVGICQFTMDNERGYVHSLSMASGTNDAEALFIMGRQTLNFIDLCGIHLARFSPLEGEDFDEHLIRWIGFRTDEENGTWEMDLSGFFQQPCQHNA